MEHQSLKIVSLKKLELDINSENGISKRNQFIYLFFFILPFLSISLSLDKPENMILQKYDTLIPLLSIFLVFYFIRRVYILSKDFTVTMTTDRILAIVFVLRNRFIVFIIIPISIIMTFIVGDIEIGLSRSDITYLYFSILSLLSKFYVLFSLENIYRRFCKLSIESQI